MLRHPRLHSLPSLQLKRALFRAAIETLEQRGSRFERAPGLAGSSMRILVTPGADPGEFAREPVTIKTSQNGWMAFTRDRADQRWVGLDDAVRVIVASVDDPVKPRRALVHMMNVSDVLHCFNRAYEERKKSGLSLRPGAGMWLSLYDSHAATPVSYFGAGLGNFYPPLSKIPLKRYMTLRETTDRPAGGQKGLTMAEAKRGLAQGLGVRESAIKITVET